MSDAPSLDALARLAAAAAEHVAALDSACVHPIRPSAAWRCGWCDGCAARADALEALRTAAPDLARGLVAAVDALRAAERERDALAAAVREERRLKALHRAALREEISAVVFDTDSDRENAAMAESRETAEAAEDATAHLDALLSGCAADVVRAGVVRDFLRAHDRVPWAVACDGPQLEREAEARTALDAALAAAEGR